MAGERNMQIPETLGADEMLKKRQEIQALITKTAVQ
jgi:hypothetical protein